MEFLCDLRNSHLIQIIKEMTIRRFIVRKSAIEKKPKIWLSNLLLIPQNNNNKKEYSVTLRAV